jgi:hypothetical protein
VRSIVPSALERSPSVLDRACLRLSARNNSIFPRRNNESDGARATQETQAYVECAQPRAPCARP